jgi:hypothetical protein
MTGRSRAPDAVRSVSMQGAADRQIPRASVSAAGHRNGRVHAPELTPANLQLAELLLDQEMSIASDLAAVTAAAEAVLDKLLRRLARLITPIGCQALLSRALHLTRAEFPFLRELEAGLTDDVWIEGLRQSVDGMDPGQARDGLVALLATLIGLVVAFIGEDLTWRLLLELGWKLPVLVPRNS